MPNKNKKRKKRESPKRLIPGSPRGTSKRAKMAAAAGMETEFDVEAAKAATGQKIPQSLKSLLDLKKQTIKKGPQHTNPNLRKWVAYPERDPNEGKYYQLPESKRLSRLPFSAQAYTDSQTRDIVEQSIEARNYHKKKKAQNEKERVIGLAKKLGSLKTQRGGGIVGKNKIIKGYKKGGKI
jgi:hypothetical protein